MNAGVFFFAVVLAFSAAESPLAAQDGGTLPAAVAPDSISVQVVPQQAPAAGAPERAVVGLDYTASFQNDSTSASFQEAGGGVKGIFFGTQRRTSNTLMIGGVGLALLGVSVVKGHPGALMGVAGLLSSIAGLYLAF
jgi:hypothetical protein